MKSSKYTEEQIVYALHQAEAGEAVTDVCRRLGVSQQTFYTWKKKYGGLGSTELKRMRLLPARQSQAHLSDNEGP